MIYKNVNGTQKLVTNIRKPKKWRRFEYLESSGTQYIDTGINLTTSDKFEFECDFTYTDQNKVAAPFFGTQSYTTGFMCMYHYTNNNQFTLYIKGQMLGFQNQTISSGTRLQTYLSIDTSNKSYSLTVNSNSISGTYNNQITDTTSHITFFYGSNYTKYKTKCYSFKVKINNTLARDYIPCEYNGQYGMWDLVENKFYENKGTGTFTVGPEIPNYDEVEKLIVLKDSNIPKGLEFYTYLQGDGQAYIDTECLLNRASTISITMQLTAKTNQDRYVGVQKSGLNILMYSGDSGNNIKTYTNISSGGTYGTLVSHNTVIHHYFINDTSHKSYCDGTSKVTHTSVPTTDDYVASCYLFWANGAAAGGQGTCRIYGCQIYDNDVLVRSLYPCTYKGQAGMWDKVNNVFYGNAGEGSFSLGDKINTNFEEVSDSMPLYDNNIHIEPDGSEWIHIFHHNNPASNLFASTNTFLTQVHTDANRWFDVSYCYKLPKYEFLLKQSTTTGSTEYKYRWIQNINPMVAGFNDVSRSKVTYNEGTGYTVPGTTYGGLCRGIGSTYLRANNNAASNWWGAIGAWGLSGGYVPSWNGQQVTTGCIDLYVRKISIKREIPVWVQKNALVGDGNAYINTGLNLDPTKKLRIVTEVTAHPDDGNPVAFFGTNDYQTGIMGIYHYTNNSEYYLYVHGQSHTGNRPFNINAGELIQFDTTIDFPNLSTTGTFQGTQINGTFTQITDTTHPITVFKSQYATKYKGKCYKFQIYQDDVLIRNYVPATMGGRPGLYDKVNYKMYFNANSSGNFTVE